MGFSDATVQMQTASHSFVVTVVLFKMHYALKHLRCLPQKKKTWTTSFIPIILNKQDQNKNIFSH